MPLVCRGHKVKNQNFTLQIMARECGYTVFETEAEATALLGQHTHQIPTPHLTYGSEQEAAEALVHLATKFADSAAMGKFYPLKKETIDVLHREEVDFHDRLKSLLKQPKGSYNLVENSNVVVKCSVCESLLNLEVLESNAERNHLQGVCPVCPLPPYAPYSVLPDDLPHDLSDRAIVKKRSLYTKDYEQALKQSQKIALQAVESYKKRRTELLVDGKEADVRFLVGWNKF